MTQYLKLSRFAALAFAMLAYACSDDFSEEAGLPDEKASATRLLTDDVSLENGYLKFASAEAFESFLGEENDTRKSTLLKQVEEASFTSWRENFLAHEEQLAPNGRTEAEDILLEDEYISSLMNEDRVLQIGQYLFKINVNEELVFVLNEQDKEHYDDLVKENDENEKIMVFTTNDDVLPLLAEGSNGTVENAREAGLFCKDGKADPRRTGYQYTYYGANRDYRMIASVRYVAIGVYFKLMAKVRNQSKFTGIWIAQEGHMYVHTDAGYKQRCRSTEYKKDTKGEVDNAAKRVVYEKVKALNKYYYRAQFSNSNGAQTRIYEIRYGM